MRVRASIPLSSVLRSISYARVCMRSIIYSTRAQSCLRDSGGSQVEMDRNGNASGADVATCIRER